MHRPDDLPPPQEAYGMAPSRMEDYDAVRLDVIRQRWDQKADHWDADLADPSCHLNDDDAYHRFLAAAEAAVAVRRAFCGGRLLVDLACGTGLVAAHFVDRFQRAVGVDISPRMLAVAAARRLARVEFLEASCFELAGRIAGAGVVSRAAFCSRTTAVGSPRPCSARFVEFSRRTAGLRSSTSSMHVHEATTPLTRTTRLITRRRRSRPRPSGPVSAARLFWASPIDAYCCCWRSERL